MALTTNGSLSRLSQALDSVSRKPAPPVSPSAKVAKKASPKTHDGRPFGAHELGAMLTGLNWANDPNKVPSPLIDARGNVKLIRGAVGLGAFLGLVNWSNAAHAPEWPVREGAAVDVGLQASVESMLAGFSWGE